MRNRHSGLRSAYASAYSMDPGRLGQRGGRAGYWSDDEQRHRAPARAPAGRRRCHPARIGRPSAMTLVAAFTLTTFLSALLLFSIQPMFAKMVLPMLGGAPSVWAVALCFFQGALLAGYCYAHALNRYAPRRYAGLIHWRVPGGDAGAADRRCRQAGASRRRAIPISGRWACSRSPSACRSWRSPPTRRCCRRGSRAPAIRAATIPTSSMARATSAASSRCSPIRCCSSRSSA